MLDLTKDNDAYFYGLLLTDGNCYLSTGGRGRISLEVTDEDIISKLYKLYKGSFSKRTRDTNFIKGHTFFIWRNSKKEFREELISYGFPVGNKQFSQCVPNIDYNQYGFWRGVIDGNGSIGLTKRGFPFLSFATKSEPLKISYLEFLNNTSGLSKKSTRNNRDSLYNICVYKEDAQNVSELLYKNSTLFIQRKYSKYLLIRKWLRPIDMISKKIIKSIEDIERGKSL